MESFLSQETVSSRILLLFMFFLYRLIAFKEYHLNYVFTITIILYVYVFCNQVIQIEQSPEVFYKNGVLKHFAKHTGKHLCQSLLFNKVARPATLLKKRPWHRCFPVNFVKCSRTSFLPDTFARLLLLVYLFCCCLRRANLKTISFEVYRIISYIITTEKLWC